MELNGLFVDKHLCVDFTIRDTVDSSCHLWFRGHAIQEFFLAGVVFFKFNVVCFLSCSALGREVVFSSTSSTNTAPSGKLVVPLRCFRPQKSHGLSLVLSSLGFRFGLSRPVCFRVFALWFLRSLHLHLVDIFRFLCGLIHILKLCVRDFVAFRDLDALLQS